MRNRLKLGISVFVRTRRRQSWPLPGAPESLGIKRMKQAAPTETVRCTIDSGHEAKTEILGKLLPLCAWLRDSAQKPRAKR
jgi:hypothetical protein